MRRQSESLLFLPLLPIFLAGMFPMLLIGLLGFFGLALFGVLLICAGLACGNEAHDTFHHDVIVHGYARGPERAAQASSMHAATRLGLRMEAIGAAMVIAAVIGFFYAG
ncbi:hypothetical protein AYJ54_26035 [Bradyrhizobium centrolobii]|uniref:Uncharacterized protein n=1 Tax=Bradyrhizobium centrolobii TaxID=1505087 RepID=A0A176YDV7_9BRAD|nr:hypothetical protein [Bradyrhizobium centrolobii]OAF02627.1 hypothetical protein AYJ54_26035 [Bradyrhizobium centrolobii]